MSRIAILTVLVFLSTSLVGVFGFITCYSCDTTFDFDPTACFDPLRPNGIIMCSQDYYCTAVLFDAKNTSMAMRSCGSLNDPCGELEEQYTRWYPDISNFECYNCTGDYCNDAPFNSTETTTKIELLDLS